MSEEEKKEETSELDAVIPRVYEIFIGGKTRRVKYNYRAWARIEETYGSVQEAMKPFRETPMKMLPELLFFGIVQEEGDVITPKMVEDWIDDFDLPTLTGILNTVRSAISGSMVKPEKKEKEIDPPPAE